MMEQREFLDYTIPYGSPDESSEGRVLGLEGLGVFYPNEELIKIGDGYLAVGIELVLLAFQTREYQEGDIPPYRES